MKVLIEARQFITPESPDFLDWTLKNIYINSTPQYTYHGMLENDEGDIVVDVEFPEETAVSIFGLLNILAAELNGSVFAYPNDLFTFALLNEDMDVVFAGSFFAPNFNFDIPESELCPVCGEDPANCPFES